jgi:CDP-paratose 2-epimerase
MGKVDQGVIALWLARHYWKIPLQYIGFAGSGHQVRDVLHVADLFDLVDYQVQHLARLDGGLFNVGGGLSNSLSLFELTEACRQITGNTVPVTASLEERPGDIPWYITDNSKVTATTGWQPSRSLHQLLQDTYEWLLENEKTLQPIFQS